MKSESRQIHRDVARRFSSAAADYDAHAAVQRDAADKLLRIAPELEPLRILDLGCGTGVLTERLSVRWPGAQITAIDVAPGMIERIKTRLPRVQAYVADIACLARNPVFDLVASNCVLHWITPFAEGLRRVADQLRPGGIAAISMMLDGTLRELHAARCEAAPDKPPTGRMPTADVVLTALRDAGLSVTRKEDKSLTSQMKSPADVIASLRSQGLTAGHLARGSQPLSRGELRDLEKIYAARFALAGGVALTYRIGYFIASKPK